MPSGMTCSTSLRSRWWQSVCGAESCVDFAEFAEDREALLREFLSLENGSPSHDTFSRVFRLLDPEAFGRAFEGVPRRPRGRRGRGAGDRRQDPAPVVRPRRRPLGPAPGHRLRNRRTGGDRAEGRHRGRKRDPRGPGAARNPGARRRAGDGRRRPRPRRRCWPRAATTSSRSRTTARQCRAEVAAFFENPPEPLPVFVTTDADHGRIELRRH